jgi:type IV pilus biogenesis protein PilP
MLLKAELKKLDVEAQVAQRTAALAQFAPGVSNLGATHVLSIEGVGGQFVATVATTDGLQFEVGPGDDLPNGLRVASISASQVVLKGKDGTSMRLVPAMAGVSLGADLPAPAAMPRAPGNAAPPALSGVAP